MTFLKLYSKGLAGVPTVAFLLAGAAHASPRHLFLDPALLTQRERVELRVNPPQRSEIVMTPDRAWEKRMISFYTTVMDKGGRLRLWSICRDDANRPNLAYAESVDGVNWTKPNLGQVDHGGSKRNNLVGVASLGRRWRLKERGCG